ncbi:EAL domain-containing protein [Guptibacillus hwajinpoensis]|uniref:EAL domain-containing protein n=1 Tax=Guptibacillus hwajinpoensis TaxID=208199 RepID=UPI0024B3548B|nr:EAL domain-containing protein [Pseudalkalibacillus hwajinpoensis]
MFTCSKCNVIPDIPSSGYLEIVTAVPQLRQSLNELIFQSESLNSLTVSYENSESLLEICHRISSHFNDAAKQMFFCGTGTVDGIKRSSVLSFPQFYSRLKHPDFIEVMRNSLFTSHMQPIITLDNNDITGYEFLMRPTNERYPFYPNELFDMARQSGLQAFLDSAARIASIKISASHLSKGVKRFINFLPSSIYDPAHCLRTTFRTVEAYNLDPRDLVFEVVETEKIDEVDHLKQIFRSYQQEGMKMALDDVGTGYATKEMLLQLKPDYAKIDRSVISHCDQDSEKQEKLIEMIYLSKEEGITLLAEGIERKEEADFCRQMGIPLGQGYYFGRPAERPIDSIQV